MMRRAWAVLFLAAAVLYWLCRDAYWVGFFNDDAFYLIGARSLLHGSFRELNDPAAPPLLQYLPGWPLLLVPAAATGSFLAARATAAAMMLAQAAAAAWAFSEDLDDEGRLCLAALCLLNPLALSLSGAVLADGAFAAAMFAVLGAARRMWASEDPRRWALLGAAAGACFYLRPVGPAVPMALSAGLLLERRPRAAACVLAAGAAVVAPWLLRNALLRGHALVYAEELAAGSGSAAAEAARRAGFYLTELYGRTLWRWPGPGGAAVGALAAAGGLAAAVAGLSRLGLAGGRRPLLVAAAALGAVLLLWAKESQRYLLPLVPFAAAWGLAGLAPRPLLRRAAAAAALASFLPPAARIAAASRARSGPAAAAPERTHAWIEAETPADAVFAAELDGRLFVRTGRRCLALPRARAGDLGAWLAANRVGYVLLEPTGDVLRTRAGDGPHDPVPASAREAALAAAGAAAVFSDAGEGTAVYAPRRPGP